MTEHEKGMFIAGMCMLAGMVSPTHAQSAAAAAIERVAKFLDIGDEELRRSGSYLQNVMNELDAAGFRES